MIQKKNEFMLANSVRGVLVGGSCSKCTDKRMFLKKNGLLRVPNVQLEQLSKFIQSSYSSTVENVAFVLSS